MVRSGIGTRSNGPPLFTGAGTAAGSRYMGYSVPRDILSITNGVDLFQRKLRINGLFDYKGGYLIFNSTKNFQCQQNPACPGRSNPGASLEDQAAAIATTAKNPTTSWGYLENGQFWRFRELTATYNLPVRYVSRIARAQAASLTLGARNLHVWTKWTAADPEQNYSQGDTQATFAIPPARSLGTMVVMFAMAAVLVVLARGAGASPAGRLEASRP